MTLSEWKVVLLADATPRWRTLCIVLVVFVGSGARVTAQLERVDPEVEVPSVSVEELESAADRSEVRIIDVRLKEDFDADPVLIPEASWRDPNDIAGWAEELGSDAPVVVYCVRGRWVSQSVTKKLRDMGVNASQLTGGIEAWKHAGKTTAPGERR